MVLRHGEYKAKRAKLVPTEKSIRAHLSVATHFDQVRNRWDSAGKATTGAFETQAGHLNERLALGESCRESSGRRFAPSLRTNSRLNPIAQRKHFASEFGVRSELRGYRTTAPLPRISRRSFHPDPAGDTAGHCLTRGLPAADALPTRRLDAP
jgi:hypothetical protein